MHYSPEVALLQCLVGTGLCIFIAHHAWCYDKYDSLNFLKAGKANRSREAFKRLMIIFYIIGCPAFAVQGGVYAWIKYQVGFLPLAMSGMPVPYQFWPPHFQKYIMPMQYTNAFVWCCELIVHIEELMFFLHLIALTPASRPWFQSWYFKTVLISSFAAAGLLFTSVAMYRNDPLMGEAVIYLTGSTFVLLSNFVFFRVFWVFPGFLSNLKMAGGTSEVVIRLKSFHETNKIRVTARFVFGVPLFVLSIDGLTQAKVLNKSLFWTDILLLGGLVGFGVQATCTLLIFQPRNIAREAGVIRATNSGIEASSGSQPQSHHNTSNTNLPRYQPSFTKFTSNSYPPSPHAQQAAFPPSSFTQIPGRPPRPAPHNRSDTSFGVNPQISTETLSEEKTEYKFGTGGVRIELDEEKSEAAIGAGNTTYFPQLSPPGEYRRPSYFFIHPTARISGRRPSDPGYYGGRRPSDPGYYAAGGGGTNFTNFTLTARERDMLVSEPLPLSMPTTTNLAATNTTAQDRPQGPWRERSSIPLQIRNFNSPIDIC